jgi:hypothetical protein
MEFGKCRLCLEDKPLCESHLVPEALYRFCRRGGHTPIAMTEEEVGPSDKEITAPVLCGGCEDHLNKHGENWLIPKLAKDQRFPFYDLVTKQTGVPIGNEIRYSCRGDQIGVRKLTNFAIGVFWKASAHWWHMPGPYPLIELGKYREEFRLFLRREAEFPKHAALMVLIMPPHKSTEGFNLPDLRRRKPFHQYVFVVPGIIFMLCVGRGLDAERKAECFFSDPAHPILLGDFQEAVLRMALHDSRDAKWLI